MRSIRLSSLLLVLALAGCATVSYTPSPQQQAQAGQARHLFDQGQYQRAAQAYQNLAMQSHGTRDYFRLRAAEAWRKSGSLARAAKALAGVQRQHLQPVDARHYDLLKAEIALQHGNTTRALRLTQRPISTLSAPMQTRALKLRARALTAAGQPWNAARERIKLDAKLSGADRARNRNLTLKLLNSMGVKALQQHASTLTPDDPAQHWIAEALAQLGVSVASAAPELTQPVGTRMLGSNQMEGYRLPQKVALVLPLSGPLAAAGNAVRQGFFASYFQANAQGNLPPVKVYDSTGTPSGAVAAYHQAVADGATLVVGPLTHDSVSAVMKQTPLPAALLALNHPDDNVPPPPNVTEFAMSPEVEGVQVARRMLKRGISKAIVLISDEGFAQRAAKAFTTQFRSQGGQVVNLTILNPAEVDYAQQIRALHAAGMMGTGIFISMRPSQARLLMPQLRLAGVQLPVFATSHVYAGRHDAVSDGDLNGVTFCDAPWMFNAQPGLPSRAALAGALPAARGTSGRLFAFGMDAWSLVPYLQWLRSHPGSYLPGASGRLTEDAFGRVHRVLTWARFENGIARPLAGNLDMGTPVLQPMPTPPSPNTPAQPSWPAPSTSSAPAPAPATSVPTGA